MELKLMQMD